MAPIIQHTNLEATFNALRSRDPSKLQNLKIPTHPDYKEVPTQNYAPVSSYSGGGEMAKYASAQAGSGIIFGQPQFFSPVHTPINWQIPSKRLEQYQWIYLPDSEFLLENYTYARTEDLDIVAEIMEDFGEEGIIYNVSKSNPIFSGNGILTIPSKYSERKCEDKPSFTFLSYGYYKHFSITEEHGVYVLDGKLWRKKRKIATNTKHRRKKGIKPNGVVKVDIPDELIIRKEAKDISLDDYLLTPVAPFNKFKTNKKQNSLAWLVGLCIADGTISKHGYDVRFTCSKEDKHIPEIKSCLSSSFNKEKIAVFKHSENSIRVMAHQKETYNFFSNYITGKLTQKRFTKEAFDLSEEEILHILGGYFDGDGSYVPEHKNLVANNYSEDMANQIWWMLIKCGIRANLMKHPLTGEHYKTSSTHYYRIIIPSADVPKLIPYMRSQKVPKNFKPKKERSLKFFYEEDGVKYFCQPIKEIKTFKYSGIGYDVQIDPDRSYVLGGYKVSNCRFFYENEPKVAASIDFYSYFPMNGWTHDGRMEKHVKKHFDKLKKRIKLEKWMKLISHEIHLLGDCFPFQEISCEHCGGSGKIGDELCEHEGGTLRRMVVLNPDYIEVYTSPLNPEPIVALKPDEELINMVSKKTPGHDKLTPEVKARIASGLPIQLDNRSVSHLKYGEGGYTTYGIGMVRRLFPILSYKTKLMVAQWIVAERLIVPIRVVKVGSEDRPAGPADIAAVQQQLAQTSNDPNLTIVTHHAFEIDWIGTSGKVLTLSNEYEFINQEILDGLMINNALLNGEGPNFSSAAVGIEAMIERLESFRGEISNWIEQDIYMPEAQRQGFISEDEEGSQEWVFPEIKWNSMHLRDRQNDHQNALSLYEKGLLSAQTVLEEFGYDPDLEIERKRFDAVQMMALGQGVGEMGGGFGAGVPGGAGGAGMPPPGGDMGAIGAPPGSPPGMGEEAPIGVGGTEMGGPAMAQTQHVLTVESQVDPSQFGGKILTDKNRSKEEAKQKKIYDQQEKQKQMGQTTGPDGVTRDQKGRINFTKPERELIDGLVEYQNNGLIKYPIQPQFEIPYGNVVYAIDFALPHLKIGIEADGEAFHSSDKQMTHDQERDMKLNQVGWTILRFTDDEIENRFERVMNTILKSIMEKEMNVENANNELQGQ